jgi:hypothetical protein
MKYQTQENIFQAIIITWAIGVIVLISYNIFL